MAIGGQTLEQGGQTLVLQLAVRVGGWSVLQRLQAIEDEQRPLLAGDLGQALALLVRALRAVRHFRVAEKEERLPQKEVGRRGHLLARALAVERPGEDRIALRPILPCQRRRPLRHERGLPLSAEGDEGEDVRSRRIRTANLRPGVVEEFRLCFAANQFRRGEFDDAGDVDVRGAGRDGSCCWLRRRHVLVQAKPLADFFRHDLSREPENVDVAVAGENAEVGQITRIANPDEHDALGVHSGNQLADVPPFELAPSFGGVLRTENDDDQFRVASIETRQVDVQVQPGQFGIVIFVVENPLLAKVFSKQAGYLSYYASMLSWKRKRNRETAWGRRITDH